MKEKIELDIVALSHSNTQMNNYAVVLGEADGVRRLPVVIGSAEAQSIAVAMERMKPTRPLTHDLFKNSMEKFGIDLQEVIISNLIDGVFYARLVCLKDGDTVEIDSRTSDALALAVRFNCPIYTYQFILEAAGIVLDPAATEEGGKRSGTTKRKKKEKLEDKSVEELNKMLDEVLANEQYESAAKIRDEINRRS